MRTIICPETSVRNYLYSLRNNPEELRSVYCHQIHLQELKKTAKNTSHVCWCPGRESKEGGSRK